MTQTTTHRSYTLGYFDGMNRARDMFLAEMKMNLTRVEQVAFLEGYIHKFKEENKLGEWNDD